MSEQAPPETRRAIMEATYRAICENGYAGLTMAAIGEEFEKSQSLIHYHYDTKEELLAAFLEYLIEHFDEWVGVDESGDPRETLDAVVDALLVGPPEREDFGVAMLELRARAPYESAYREQFVENDAHLRGLVADLVGACLEDDAEVDPDEVARRILIAIEGARTRRIVVGDDEEIRVARAMIEEELDRIAGSGS